jgi:hypothetical protein
MKRRSYSPTGRGPVPAALVLLIALALLGSATVCRGSVVGPYRVDSFTLHLWHFDEPAGSTVAEDAAETEAIPLTLQGTTALGSESKAGFGTALQTGNSAYADGGIQPIGSFTWSDGAFTFEAIIRPDVDPLAPPNQMNIVCADRAGDLSLRSWQFRINTKGELEFILLAGGVQSMVARLPESGPNAALMGQWYHVAVTYNGRENEDGNLKLYWTLLDDSRNEAALLAEFTMQADLAGEPLLTVGTSGRNAAGEGFRGVIDEVRISSIDRYANEMQFVQRSHVGPYSPDAYTLHLWHFNDPAGSTTVNDDTQYAPMALTLQGAASLGQASYEAFGTALQTNNSAYATANVQPLTEFTGIGGAFTFEGIVRPDVDPLAPPNHMNMICADSAGGLDVRSWQFRINTAGRLEFILLNGGVQSLTAPLPNSGPNAAVAGQWYHVAAAYNGHENEDGNLKLYWTLIDKGKTEAALLATFKMQADLGGQPLFTIGTSGRNPAGEGFRGLIDEVRISSVDRRANEMLFTESGSSQTPAFTLNPKDTLVGLGETLKLQTLVSGGQPMSYQWQFNGVDLPGQTEDTLVIPNVGYEQEGGYRVVATNSFGRAISDEAHVTIGASFSGLFNTGVGFDPNGVLGLLPGNAVDPHYFLIDSNDTAHLDPETLVWVDDVGPFPSYIVNGPKSAWIGAVVNPGTNPVGRYVYRTTFVLDTVDPCSATLEGVWTMNGVGRDILINGKSTGMMVDTFQSYRIFSPFTITEGFIPGLNTLDFVVEVTPTATGAAALRAEVHGVGRARPPGVPQMVTGPQSVAVRNGGKTVLSVIATGRAPLSYQWRHEGQPIAGPAGTQRALALDPVSAASAGSYSVQVSNADGTATSAAATVTVTSENHPPVGRTYHITATRDQSVAISILRLLTECSDPDGDQLYFTAADAASANGGTILDTGGASIIYQPPAGFVGLDRFSFSIADESFAEAKAEVEVEVVAAGP